MYASKSKNWFNGIQSRKRLFADRVSANKKLFADTVSANKKLFADSGVPIEKIARLRLSCDSYCTLSESTKLLKLLYFNYEY